MENSGEKKLILVVDDEEGVRDALNEKLTEAGFEVITAQDGEEGLAMALEKRPDLIMLDILMPKMDGLAMLEELRKNEWGKNALVTLLTNLSDSESVSRAIENAGSEFIVKSDWKIDDIIDRVKMRFKDQ